MTLPSWLVTSAGRHVARVSSRQVRDKSEACYALSLKPEQDYNFHFPNTPPAFHQGAPFPIKSLLCQHMLDNSFLSVRKGSPFLQHAQTTWVAQMGCRERTGYPTDSQDAGLCASEGKKKRAIISGHGGDQITPVAAPTPQLSLPCLQWHHLARASPAVCRGSGTMELPDRDLTLLTPANFVDAQTLLENQVTTRNSKSSLILHMRTLTPEVSPSVW